MAPSLIALLLLLTVAGRAGAAFTGASGVDVSADVGTAFNGAVATYTDSNPAETAASYSATIDWGDGSPASADSSITGPSPFTVFGVHTYTKAGTFTVTVTITEDTSLASISATATAQVSGLTSATGDNFSIARGAVFNGAVATFTDSDSTEGAAAFAATIDWGDGTPASADSSITGPSPFTVFGVHTYTKAGSFTVTVTVTEIASLASISATATATVSGLTSATGDNFSVVQGMPFNGAVATFTDSDSTETAASYSATIDWGDGTPATADSSIVGPSPFTVFGVHTYAHEGSFTVTVTITEDTSLASISATATATVSDVLTGSPIAFPAFAKIPFTGEVATFTDTETTNTAADFVAVIHWGDGSMSAGTVAGGSGAFTVSGSHTYASSGSFPVAVTLTENAPGTATATVTSTANVADSIATIPTLGLSGLLILGLTLAAAGFYLLRKG
jgi:hypothetical protein